ncbi:MAG: LuxR C-terminal-related transcriptional regulator [Candidatus Nealsonbacteria bacterium]
MKKENRDERIENLLALILLKSMKGAKRGEKALGLSLAGFSNIEIANLLQISAKTVANILSEMRKKKKGKGSQRLKKQK